MDKYEKTKGFDMDLNIKSPVPIYEQIKNAVKLAIFKKQLVEGDKIISISDLSARHGVNPLTTMKAYTYLEMEGFLYSRRGIGYYVQIDKEKVKKERKEIFREEVSGFLKKIGDMGYTVDDLLDKSKINPKKKSGEKKGKKTNK